MGDIRHWTFKRRVTARLRLGVYDLNDDTDTAYIVAIDGYKILSKDEA